MNDVVWHVIFSFVTALRTVSRSCVKKTPDYSLLGRMVLRWYVLNEADDALPSLCWRLSITKLLEPLWAFENPQI